MPQVLVIEPQPELRLQLGQALRREGYGTLISSTGRAALELARTAEPDLLLLEPELPDLSGSALLAALRREPRTGAIAFILVSHRGSEADRIAGLELGAEDYVVKPYSLRELMLRVRIVLRRVGTPSLPPGELLRCGPLTIDPVQRRVFLDEGELSLTPLEFKLLSALLGKRDRVLTRESLLSEVWGLQPHLETRTVDVHVRRLREKLGESALLIETVRGIGYRLKSEPVRTE